MQTITFVLDGKLHTGHITYSREEFPHYYWCFIGGPELVKELGDCIGFKDVGNGQLVITEFYPKRWQGFIDQIIELLQTYKTRLDSDV
jgi:hypothetical protein